jgi:hypothetical protein
MLTPRHCARSEAIFDMYVADFSIEDCRATLAMTRGGLLLKHFPRVLHRFR